MNRRLVGVFVGSLVLAACGGDPAKPGPGERAIARAEKLPVPATALDGVLAPEERTAYLASQQGALRKALAPAVAQGWLLVVANAADSRVVIASDSAFDGGDAQLRPELLLPTTALAEVLQRDRASVLHVIAVENADVGLAERRAQAVAAVLRGAGAAPGRVRAEARVAATGRPAVVVVFKPVVAPAATQAWMPPAGG